MKKGIGLSIIGFVAVVLAIGLISCGGGGGGGTPGVASVKVICLDLNDTGICDSVPVGQAGLIDFFVPAAYAADLTVTTNFDLGDIAMGTVLKWSATITNNSPDVPFEGIFYRHPTAQSGQWGPLSIPPGGSVELALEAETLGAGPGEASFQVYACDDVFTVDIRPDTGAWMGLQWFEDWIQSTTPAAIATATYNMISVE